MRSLLLALVILTQLCTLAYAQASPPEANAPAPKPATTNTPQVNDTDKERVQSRWGTSTGATTQKTANTGKPVKPQKQNSSGATQ
ncbi:MAG: hypothetical protein HY795_05315 [Desulfovibrio sp.]|nr:hypothetical protein [Desulfovibrio sp.]MBI4959252.1 hypothetical protein [Desulfovibrio sp.]